MMSARFGDLARRKCPRSSYSIFLVLDQTTPSVRARVLCERGSHSDEVGEHAGGVRCAVGLDRLESGRRNPTRRSRQATGIAFLSVSWRHSEPPGRAVRHFTSRWPSQTAP
jgi:hypothetical protein